MEQFGKVEGHPEILIKQYASVVGKGNKYYTVPVTSIGMAKLIRDIIIDDIDFHVIVSYYVINEYNINMN